MSESLQEERRAPFYPVFLDMQGRHALVVGGGGVAKRKVEGLLEAGSQVRVVAPQVVSAIEEWARNGRITLDRRCFMPDDVNGAFLVYCSTNNSSVNECVFEEAEKRGVPVNVVDDPVHCSFIVPSRLRRGMLQVAVSTGGASPNLAKQIRSELEHSYPRDWEIYLDLLNDLRTLVKRRVPDAARRQFIFEQATDPLFLRRLRAGEKLDAQMLFNELSFRAGLNDDDETAYQKGDA